MFHIGIYSFNEVKYFAVFAFTGDEINRSKTVTVC